MRHLAGRLLSVGLLCLIVQMVHGAAPSRELAVTIDDLDVNSDDTPRLNLDQRDEAILRALRHEHIKAALFVCGKRVDNEAGRRHVAAWNREGHLIGNHTYSHFDYPEAGYERFSRDVLHGEQ